MNQVNEMELDYRIEFPSDPLSMDSNNENNVGSLVSSANQSNGEIIWPIPGYEDKDAKKPLVVVVIGWSGSLHKQLSKYSDIYVNRGCIIVRCITPRKALFSHTHQLPSVAQRLILVLKENNLDTHPIFFHVMSNGGAYTYSFVLRELQIQGIELDHCGTIYDSCPTPTTLPTYFKATLNIGAGYNTVTRYLIASMVIFVLGIQIFWCHIKAAAKQCMYGEQLGLLRKVKKDDYLEGHIPATNWLGRLCKIQNHHCLFFYCDTDELNPMHQVEEAIEIIASHGNKTEKLMFKESEHVMHYRKYPEQYVRAITDFIRQTMKTKQGSTILWNGF